MAADTPINRAFRCKVRLSLSDLDRGVYAQSDIVLAQYPDEPDEHVLLRFLAHVFFHEDYLEDGCGWLEAHEPDLLRRDMVGDLRTWIECGAPPMKRLSRAMGHNKDARFIAFFADEEEAATFAREVAASRPRNRQNLELQLVDRAFMDRLEVIGRRSMEWAATICEGTCYLDCNGEVIEGRLQRLA